MAVHSPVRGGFGSIAAKYLGPFAGFLTRWGYWTCTMVITGIELVAVGTYLTYWWPQLPLWVGIAVFGAPFPPLKPKTRHAPFEPPPKP